MRVFTRMAFCLSLLGVSFIINMQSASATSAWDYNPGNIISDAVMRNSSSMDEGAIQNFLKSKNSCNDTRTYIASWYPTVSYHIENGHFVCMADESFNGQSAAHIIYRAAQDYHINPQVLIVLLQKEQGLVTDTFPHNYQYRTAAGYGCPDTSACESRYYGFENQVRNAAALFDSVLNGGWTNYPIGNRYVLYSPRGGCGGSTINIENRATSALYRYTPYQPNDAAKNAGYGTGDYCSSYGNRNFFLYFSDWFGSTQAQEQNVTTIKQPLSAPEFYIPDGNYQLLTTSGKALDVSGAGTSNGTNIQIWTKNGTAAQTFYISRRSDGYYKIANPNSGKVLDVSGASMDNGANIQIWEDNDTCAQKWVASIQDGNYVLRNACSGNALDVSGGHVATEGQNVQSWEVNGTKAQTWRLVALDAAIIRGGTYSFRTVEGKTSLDVYNSEMRNGANIQIWSNNTSEAQKFKLFRGTDGYYRIFHPYVGRSVDVSGASTANGTNIQLWEDNDTCAQKWAISQSDEYYVFRNACSGKALDVNSGAINIDQTNVHLWEVNDTNAQKWKLIGRR